MLSGRTVLFVLPAITVILVAYALFVVAGPREVRLARVYGGPTVGHSELALRVAVLRREHERLDASGGGEIAVVARTLDGSSAQWRGAVDAAGSAHVVLTLPHTARAPLAVIVSDPSDGTLLAEGHAALSIEGWSAPARRRGGWLEPRPGAVAVSVAPARGALAWSFSEPLLVRVLHQGRSVLGAEVELTPEGAEVVPSSAKTNARGIARVTLEPRDLVVALRARAVLPTGEHGEWYGTLPLVAGALHAALAGPDLVVRSAVPREMAYYSIVTRTARLAGGSLALLPDGRGGAEARVRLPPLPFSGDRPYAVVSAEPELDSQSTVGWPLAAVQDEPELTFDVADRLLVDGLPLAQKNEAARKRLARVLAVGSSALALFVSVVLVLVEVRRERRELVSLRGAEEGLAGFARARMHVTSTIVALLCIALGFGLLGLIALYRLG